MITMIEIENLEEFKMYNGMFDVDNCDMQYYNYIICEYIIIQLDIIIFYKSLNCKVVMMKPIEYLKTCAENMRYSDLDVGISNSSVKFIENEIKNNRKLYLPFISMLPSFGQEGRNRSYVANKIGEELIPVVYVYYVDYQSKVNKLDEIIKCAKNINMDVYEYIDNYGYHNDINIYAYIECGNINNPFQYK